METKTIMEILEQRINHQRILKNHWKDVYVKKTEEFNHDVVYSIYKEHRYKLEELELLKEKIEEIK